MKVFPILLIFFSLSAQEKRFTCDRCTSQKPIEILVLGNVEEKKPTHPTIIAKSLSLLGKKTALHSLIKSPQQKREIYKWLREEKILPFMQTNLEVHPLSWKQASWLHIDGRYISKHDILDFCRTAKKHQLKSSLYLPADTYVEEKLFPYLDLLILYKKRLWTKEKVMQYAGKTAISIFVDPKGIWINDKKRNYILSLDRDSDYFIAGILFGILREKTIDEAIRIGKLITSYKQKNLPWDQIKHRIQLEESMVEMDLFFEEINRF